MTAPTGQPPTDAPTRPAFRMFDMVLFSVCAMLLLSQLALTAQTGTTVVFWTIFIIIVFFIPYGLVTSELGSTYPDAGGIYSWIVRAFGNKWGTRVSWWYWINVPMWVPSVYLIFSGAVSSMFFDGKLNFWVQIALAVVLIWINYWVNSRTLETGAWVSNVGAAITVGVIICIAIAAGIFMSGHGGSATSWTVSNMLPSGGIEAVVLALPVIIYNFLGFELMSSASTQMENPKRDVPRTIFIAGAMIGGFYLIATVGMQLIIPADQLSETTGLQDVLKLGFGTSGIANIVVTALGIGSLFCFFACLIPWTIGANIAAQESALQGDLPKVFARTHPERGTPIGAARLGSIISTVVVLLFAILTQITDGAIDDVFWSLFAFSSLLFLLPYITMMLAFLKLRRIDPDASRPYRVPGGPVMTQIITWVPVAMLALSVIFFLVNPFDFSATDTFPVLIGVIIAVAIQEYFVFKAPQWTRERAIERELEAAGHEAAPADASYGTPS